MAVEIKNHSDGTIAGVTREFQLKTRTESHELNHHVSWTEENTYQAIFTDTGIVNGGNTVMWIKNTSATKKLVVSFIRVSDMSTITTYVAGNYFSIGVNQLITLDTGDAVTPVNMNIASGKVAEATVKGDLMHGWTDSGAFAEVDRVYTVAGKSETWNKQGSLILGLNDTLSIKFVSTGTGSATARVTFMMMENDRD